MRTEPHAQAQARVRRWLGDVTLLVVGARFVDGPRRKVIVDGAPVALQLAEFALAAPRDGSGKLVYLFYSSTLS